MKSDIQKDTVKLRNGICRKKRIKILKIFDTNEYEPYKDVILGEWHGKKIILRTGEHRPLNFFRGGYAGKHLVIPKSYLISPKYNYEIEEHLKGKLFCELLPKPKYNKLIVSNEWLRRLIRAHWEFQKIAKKINLPKKIKTKEMAEKFLKPALKLIRKEDKSSVKNVIYSNQYKFFWNKSYPCKWKYAPDNLIAMSNKRVGFIDLAGASQRHWGYDLGWLFWPQWFHFSQGDYSKAGEHFDYLQWFFNRVYTYAPVVQKKNKEAFFLKCNLVLFERVIGALYDISANISHTRKMNKSQKKQMTEFLNKLLVLCLEKL